MDQEAKKTALRMLSCGLYVVTSKDGSDVAAGTVTWMSQASFTPPVIMTAIRGDSHLHSAVEKSKVLAVSIVGSNQKALAEAFFRSSRVEDGKINGYAIQNGQETGAPIVTDCPAWFEARVTDSVRRGDHTIYVAEVVNAGVNDSSSRPLEMSDTEWTYGG